MDTASRFLAATPRYWWQKCRSQSVYNKTGLATNLISPNTVSFYITLNATNPTMISYAYLADNPNPFVHGVTAASAGRQASDAVLLPMPILVSYCSIINGTLLEAWNTGLPEIGAIQAQFNASFGPNFTLSNPTLQIPDYLYSASPHNTFIMPYPVASDPLGNIYILLTNDTSLTTVYAYPVNATSYKDPLCSQSIADSLTDANIPFAITSQSQQGLTEVLNI